MTTYIRVSRGDQNIQGDCIEGGMSAALSPFRLAKIEIEVSRLDLRN